MMQFAAASALRRGRAEARENILSRADFAAVFCEKNWRALSPLCKSTCLHRQRIDSRFSDLVGW
jgi:hypothetical protein